MKKILVAGAIVCTAVAVSFIVSADREPHRESVAPWDTDDHPDPESQGSLVPKPANLTVASGYSAKFSSGHTIKLKAITRGYDGPKELRHSINERAWFPDGSPYYGEELRQNGGAAHVLGDSQKGVRCLSFDIASETDDDVEVYGYIPETARTGTAQPELHGRDIPKKIEPSSRWGFTYRIPVVVEGHAASSYRFALASGSWKPVFSTTSIPKTVADQDIAVGTWGRLRMVPPKKYRVYSGPPYAAKFVVEPADPVETSYRVHLLDKSGLEVGNSGIFTASISEQGLSQVDKIVIEGRPFAYVEFQNVHFDPDPAKWGKSHWGSAGEATISKVPGIAQLEGVLRPHLEGNRWQTAEFFAPDGIAWREYPEPGNLAARFSTSSWPAGEPLVGVISVDPALLNKTQNVTVEAYEASSSVPGQGLGRKLGPPWPNKFQRAIGQTVFERPKTDYVQFKLQVSDEGWKKEGEVKPPAEPLETFTPKQLELMESGATVYTRTFTVCIRGSGSLDFFYQTRDGKHELKQKLVTWPGDGREVRLVARLKSGERIMLHNNGASGGASPADSGPEYIFSLDKTAEPVLDALRSKVALKDIELFEVETRSYGKPEYLVAKLPPKRKEGR